MPSVIAETSTSEPTCHSRAASNDATESRRNPLGWLMTVVAVSRIFVTAVVELGRADATNLSDASPAPVNRWLQPWTIFDAHEYLAIARHGYARTTSAFFPLYPKLIGLFGGSTTFSIIVGMIISTLAFAVAAVVLYRLVDLDYGSVVAKRAVVIAAFYPFAALWGALYTESVFLLLVTTTWWLVRRRKWGLAIFPALLCGLTRNAGVVLGIALALEWWQQHREHTKQDVRTKPDTGTQPVDRKRSLPGVAPLATIAAPMAAFVGVMVAARLQFGAGGGLGAQEFYGRKWSWPWWAVWKDVSSLTDVLTFGKIAALAAIAAASWFTIRDARRHRWGYTFFVVGILGMHLLYARQRDPFTIGAARYLLTTFPFLVSLSLATTKVPQPIVRMLTVLLITLCVVGSLTFGRGQFEMG